MTQTISNQTHWQKVLRQQKLANAQRWLTLIETHDDPTSLVANDYDNFLRALETTLQSPGTFDLAYRLIQSIYIVALDYADWDRWLIYLENALGTSQTLNKHSEQATLLVQIGDILYRTANLKRAKESYETAAKQHKLLKNQAGYASTLSKLAVLYDLQGDMYKGVALSKQALIIAESLDNKKVAAQINLNLSSIYYRARDWEASLFTAQKAYRFYKEQGPPTFATKALMNIVAIWAELGRWEKVDQAANNLMNTLTVSGDIRTLSQLKNNLGFSAFNQANYEVAETAWQEALRLHSQIQEPKELASLYNNLGMVYTEMKEWDTAEDMLYKAITAHEQLGDIYNWANSLDNLADLYEAQGKTAVCQQALEKAHAGLQPIANSPHTQELLNTITQRLNSLAAS